VGAGRTGDEHVREWAGLHLTEAPTGFVGGWLRASAAVARPLARAGVSPNAVTVAALVAAAAAVPLALVDGWPGPAAACLAVTVSGLLDSLDGAVAVQAGRATKVGFLLDSALDRLADAAYPAALALVAGPTKSTATLAVAATAVAWYLEYVRARASLATADGAATAARPVRQVITPGERPTRIVLTAVGLGLPALAAAALWGQVVIVGASALFLLGHAILRLRQLDREADQTRSTGAPPAATG
jgi:CDP-diacylglycerol--glycerol-3-phosphate 3-phosphatidyltransferase